jgi:hypothetical protein
MLFVVTNCIPEVAVKLMLVVPAVTLIVDEKVKLPNTTIELFIVKAPLYPVKFIFLYPPVVVAKAKASVPAVILKLIEFASENAPIVTVRVPIAPEYVQLTTGVPVTVIPVTVLFTQIVALLPVSVMLPVLNAIVLVLLLFVLKAEQVKAKLPKLKVPWVRVKVPLIEWAAPSVKPNVALFNVAVAQADPAAVVQVPVPELASKFTMSVDKGGPAPPMPPESKDQFVVFELSQVPVPPTQKYVAMLRPHRSNKC